MLGLLNSKSKKVALFAQHLCFLFGFIMQSRTKTKSWGYAQVVALQQEQKFANLIFQKRFAENTISEMWRGALGNSWKLLTASVEGSFFRNNCGTIREWY
jgi:hypothetical protein